MTTPTDPIPEFRLGADRYARREPVAGRAAEAEGLDSETLEVVETFEALYAELSSAAPAAAPERGVDDDLLVDLPAEFEPAAPALRVVESRTHDRTPGLAQERPAPAPSQAAASDADPALDLDDAFAMLRAAESKGRANAQRDAVDREETQSAVTAMTPASRSSHERKAQRSYAVSAPASDWSGKARAMWPKVAGAAAIALIVGAGIGFLAGRTPEPVASLAKITLTPQGGARLQFDYELRKN